MSRRGENIYKRKDGRWEGRYIKSYNCSGKPKYGYIYAKTYAETKEKLLNVKANLCNPISETQKKTVCYAELLDLWLESVKIKIKESSYAHYCQIVNSHLRLSLGDFQVDQISTLTVENYVGDLLSGNKTKGQKPLSSKTVNDILTVVRATLDFASDLGYSVKCNLKRLVVRKQSQEIRVLSVDEQKLLTGFLLKDTDLFKLGTLVSLYAGIRIGELCALKWSDINIENRFIKVEKTIQRIQNTGENNISKTKIIITEPKTMSSKRIIPIPLFLLDILGSFKKVPNAFVLTGKIDKYAEPRVMQYHFKKYIKQTNLDSVNFHALRHTFATRCVENGFEIKCLSEILGHSSVNITLNRYVHSSFELKSLNMEKISLYI